MLLARNRCSVQMPYVVFVKSAFVLFVHVNLRSSILNRFVRGRLDQVEELRNVLTCRAELYTRVIEIACSRSLISLMSELQGTNDALSRRLS